ncbi:MAG: diaminopimelate decarboxylase family protein [Acutalibacter sp.]
MTEERLLELVGRRPTPLYLFNGETLERRVEYLRRSLPEKATLCYAVKANPFLAGELSGLVDRLEICSPGELRICQRLGLPREKFVISGVFKEPRLMAQLIAQQEAPCLYTVESLGQFAALRQGAVAAKKQIPLLLRLTSGNQFGLDPQEAEELLCQYSHDPFVELRGIQYFSGTQKTSLKRIKGELDRLDALFQDWQQRLGILPGELELGPGLPVAYFPQDRFDEDAFLREFSSLLENMWYPGPITLELGRSITASCGTYVTRVVDVKTNSTGNYAILDGGVHHLVYYGQSMGMRHPPLRQLGPRDPEDLRTWNLCGSLCTIHDLLAKQIPLASLKPGDLLAFDNAGAYCMTEGISLFLSRDLPEVLLLDAQGELHTLRRPVEIDLLNTPRY